MRGGLPARYLWNYRHYADSRSVCIASAYRRRDPESGVLHQEEVRIAGVDTGVDYQVRAKRPAQSAMSEINATNSLRLHQRR
jgi:hypothetical protein